MPGKDAAKDPKDAKEVKEEEKKETAPPEPMSPGNQGKWIESSEKNMMQARNLIRDMLTVVRNNEVAEASNKEAAQEADKREKEAKKAAVFNKAAAHEKVIATSFKCMQDIEDGILQTEDSLSKLTHERYRGFANLQVCERRLELRQKRPDPEKFRDALTDALNSEKQILEDSRKELLELEKQGKKIVDDMRDKRKFLSEDTGSRRLQMMEDLKTLSPQVALPPVKSPKANSPKKGNGEKNEVTFPEEGAANGEESPKEASEKKPAEKDPKEEVPKEAGKDGGKPKEGKDAAAKEPKEAKDTKEAKETKETKEAKPAEEAAKEGEEAAATNETQTPSGHKLSPEEQKKAEQASKELIADTLKLLEKCSCHRNTSLETIFKVKQDTNRANHRTEDCLSRRTAELAEMKKQLEKHALDVEAAIQRAERSLDRTERRLDSKDAKKVEKFANDKEILKNLHSVKEKLKEDIQNKFAALEIDNMCRRVTAAKASEAKMKQAASMTRSGSAPNLQKKKTGTDLTNEETGTAEGDKLPDIHQKPNTPPGNGNGNGKPSPSPKAAAGTPP